MNYYETIRSETAAGFDIVFSIKPEDSPPDWDFENEQDRQDTLNRIERGDLAYFVARVEAFKNGVLLSTDYLGGCCYDTPQQFVDHSDYYGGMVERVVEEARETISKLCETQES